MVPAPRGVGSARTCPLCHTPAAAAADALDADSDWTCAACGQGWSARQLERVASYAAYVATHSAPVPSFADGVPHPRR